MSRNRVLERLQLALLDLLDKTREKYLQTEERKQRSLQGHREILAAIKKGDSIGTRQAMRRHLESVEDVLLKKKRKEVDKSRNSQGEGKFG
jgi:DNA-binding FadR family transcriptional regulator